MGSTPVPWPGGPARARGPGEATHLTVTAAAAGKLAQCPRRDWTRAHVTRGSASARLRGGPALRHRAGTQNPGSRVVPAPGALSSSGPAGWPCAGPRAPGPGLCTPEAAGGERCPATGATDREQNTGPAQGGPRLAAAAPSPVVAGRHAGALCDLETSLRNIVYSLPCPHEAGMWEVFLLGLTRTHTPHMYLRLHTTHHVTYTHTRHCKSHTHRYHTQTQTYIPHIYTHYMQHTPCTCHTIQTPHIHTLPTHAPLSTTLIHPHYLPPDTHTYTYDYMHHTYHRHPHKPPHT